MIFRVQLLEGIVEVIERLPSLFVHYTTITIDYTRTYMAVKVPVGHAASCQCRAFPVQFMESE